MFASWNARAVGLNLSARETIELAGRTGFGGVDLLVRDLDEAGEDPRALRGRMEELGLRGGAWSLPVAWKGEEGRFAEDLRALPKYARIARQLGLTTTGTWVLPELQPETCGECSVDSGLARAVDFHLDRLGRIAAILEDHGQKLGLEIMGPVTARGGISPPFIGRYSELAERLGSLASRRANVGILLDAFHLFASGEGHEAGFAWGVDRVVWVHVADPTNPNRLGLLDSERSLPRERGPANCRILLSDLQERGYDGPVTAEPLSACRELQGLEPSETAVRAAASLAGIWPRSS